MAQTTSVSQRMSKPYAYRMFLYMALALITAAPLTELSLVSYLAAYAQNRLRQTLAATLGAGAVAAAAGAGMHGLIKKGRNPQGFLGTGVVSWLGGLVWLIAGCVGAGLFFCLALCLMGMTLSLGAAWAMCADLGRVLSFAQGREQGDAAHARGLGQRVREAAGEFLEGQVLKQEQEHCNDQKQHDVPPRGARP